MLFHDEAALAPGDVVGSKLVVERLLGAGGMGIVYAATHSALQSRVAIKVLRPSVAQRHHAIERFLREARVSAQLSSPHTVRVQDIGELPSGLPYMVMEFLDGRDLGAQLEAGGPLTAGRLVPLILDACEALAEAHALGFVHRDLKPANLFLARTAGGHELLKVLDFGIAKALIESDSPSWLTTSNAVLGSAAYMSPEQLIASRDVDSQTDIWALGVVMFQLLTGHLPFSADTAGGMGALILHAATPSIRVLHPALSPALDAIVGRCLAKKKEQRFASVAELSAALAALPLDRELALPPGPLAAAPPGVGLVTTAQEPAPASSPPPAPEPPSLLSPVSPSAAAPDARPASAPLAPEISHEGALAVTSPPSHPDLALPAGPRPLVSSGRSPRALWSLVAASGVVALLLGSRLLGPSSALSPASAPSSSPPASPLSAIPSPAGLLSAIPSPAGPLSAMSLSAGPLSAISPSASVPSAGMVASSAVVSGPGASEPVTRPGRGRTPSVAPSTAPSAVVTVVAVPSAAPVASDPRVLRDRK